MKAVIYARYSSDNQREESIEGQLCECTAFAEKNAPHYLSNTTPRQTKGDHRFPDHTPPIQDAKNQLLPVNRVSSETHRQGEAPF